VCVNAFMCVLVLFSWFWAGELFCS